MAWQTCGEKACHKACHKAYHPERSEGARRPGTELLRCAQDDRPESTHVRSREVFSPHVYADDFPLAFLQVVCYTDSGQKKGTSAIGTTVRYTQVSRVQVKEKLKLLKG